MLHHRRTVAAVLLCFVLLWGVPHGHAAEIEIADFDFRDGDVVFQHLPSRLCRVICDVTDSQFSHCGVVVHKDGKPHVLEAIGPVRYLPIRKWIAQGDRSRFAQFRLKSATDEQIQLALRKASSMLGRPYDIQYEMDDAKIYCSELIYKAFQRGPGIELGTPEKLGDLNWRPHELFIRLLADGELPLDRIMVTPASVAQSPHLKLIYSSFPARKDEPRHKLADLAGRWRGQYTIRDLAPATVVMEFDDAGRFKSGTIRLADGKEISVRRVDVAAFRGAHDFQATVFDARGFQGDVDAAFRDQGRRITGIWEDDQGYRGVFAIEKDAERDAAR